MSKTLLCYASESFVPSQSKLKKSARNHGLDEVLKFNLLWMRCHCREFLRKNSQHFQHAKGGGFWVWKPFIILETLKKLNSNDYLIYLDAGIEILRPLDLLFDLCDKTDGLMLFSTMGLKNEHWTKRDAFILMEADDKKYREAKQVVGGILVMKKTKFTLAAMKEWLNHCQNFQILSDLANQCGKPNFPGFRAHRHDQSVLSLLAVKWKLPIFRSPCQFANQFKMPKFRVSGEFLDDFSMLPSEIRGNYAPKDWVAKNSPYGTLFHIHRNSYPLHRFNFQGKILRYFQMWRDAKKTQQFLTQQHD